MYQHRPRTIGDVLEEQARRAELLRRMIPDEPRRPVIAVSRQHGARGDEVARSVAETLGLTFYDREIITRIAEDAHLSERVVSALDERRDRTWLAEWLTSLVDQGHLSPYGYIYHLTRVIGAIARLGGAVILGRGAHLILGPGEALRVLVVAPLAVRVATIAAREGIDEGAARRRVAEVELEREAYLRRYFHTGFADPATFDVEVNTGVLGADGAVAAICTASSTLAARTHVGTRRAV